VRLASAFEPVAALSDPPDNALQSRLASIRAAGLRFAATARPAAGLVAGCTLHLQAIGLMYPLSQT
jgi:hypothetical protein